MSKKRVKETKEKQPELSFEDAMRAAEAIVHELEEGTLDLTDSLQKYERGIKLLRQCFELLDKAELRVSQLSGFDAEGRMIMADFQAEEEGDLEQKARSRARRRTAAQPDQQPPHESAGDSAPTDARASNRPGRASVDDSEHLF